MKFQFVSRASASVARLFVVSVLVAVTTATAQAQDRNSRMRAAASEFPIRSDDGDRLPNHTVKPSPPIDRRPGVVVVANPKGTTTLVEFYDLNCPYCRVASTDIADLVATDPELRLVLVPYPVLGIPSIAASRVELAVAKLGTPEQFYEFHRKVYAERGVMDGVRALKIAEGLGFTEAALMKAGDNDDVTKIMKDHFMLGTELGLTATPSFVINNVAVVGYPGRDSLQKLVDAMHHCGKVQC
jgi:protein-disulfide isomerase